MKRPLAVLALLAAILPAGDLAAQAPTSQAYGGWKREEPLRLSAFGPSLWLRMDTVSNWVIVRGSAREVYQKTQHVYGTLKFKTTLADSMTGLVGNAGFNHTGPLAGQRMSYWLSCGEGMAGPNADTWRITLAVVSFVERVTDDSTRLRSAIIATARNLAEGSKTPMPCTTSGQLEAEIHKRVAAMPPVSGNQ